MLPWPHTLHFFGALVWFAGLMTALHCLAGWVRSGRKIDFNLLAANVGRVMDTGATMSIVTGVVMLTSDAGRALLRVGSFHAKLTLVLGLLGIHGFVRVSLARAGRGEARDVPRALVPITVVLFFAAIAMIIVRPF